LKRVVQSPAATTASATSSALAADKILSDPGFSTTIIAWQQQHGRHVLPWQNTRDAYRIWLSEIMLQQTQVATVIPYYQRFLQRFPDLPSLAQAAEGEVMEYWAGLGYYSRARNLHRCAQRVLTEYGGQFPPDPAQLADLPGIGRSTAAAIAAFSHGARAAILDGNVKRVFARVFGIDEFPGNKAVEQQLWLRAEALLPEQGVESYTQGLMDLGATLCTRTRPACERCPLNARCVALREARVHELPVRKPKKSVPQKYASMLVVEHDQEILLLHRPALGIWAGLWSLPELDGHQSLPCALDVAQVAQILQHFGPLDLSQTIEALPSFEHGFTHYKLRVQPYRVALRSRTPQIAQDRHQWLAMAQIAGAALPAPVKKLLLNLAQND
jgi:A/G-specific adenine glycosylase